MSIYRRVVHDRLYEVIAGEIEQLIVDGQLKPGDSLPPERELGERFGVSRTAVREAIKVLCEKRLLSVQPGRGTVVAHPSPSLVSDSLSLLLKLEKASVTHLTEVRLALEPEMAARAAIRATPEQVSSLERLIEAEQTTGGSVEALVPLDISFHQTISDAAHNPVARAMLLSIQGLMHESMAETYSRMNDNTVEESIAAHAGIVSAIRDRDPEGARRRMRRHLRTVAQTQGLALDPEPWPDGATG